MSDSSDNEELFGMSEEENEEEVMQDDPPEYRNGGEFLRFEKEHKINVHPN
jgi:hypothetical protein